MAAIPPMFKDMMKPAVDLVGRGAEGKDFCVRQKSKNAGVGVDGGWWVNGEKFGGSLVGDCVWELGGVELAVRPGVVRRDAGCVVSGSVKVKGLAPGVVVGGDATLRQGEGPVLHTDITTFRPFRIVTTANLKKPAAPTFTLSATTKYKALTAGLQTTVNGNAPQSHTAALTFIPTSSVFLGATWNSLPRPILYSTYTHSPLTRLALKSDLSKALNVTAAVGLKSKDERNALHLSVKTSKDAMTHGYGAVSRTWQHVTSTVHVSGPVSDPSKMKFGTELVFTEK